MSKEPTISPESLREKAQELYEQKVSPEKEKPRELNPQELAVKEEMKRIANLPQQPQPNDIIAKVVNDLLTLDDRAQLSELIRLAFSKNVNFTLNVAKNLSPLVIDTFHDLLARDEHYHKLLKENKL